MPVDLIDRIMIVMMMRYRYAPMEQIIKIRALTEGISIADDALALLAVVGTKSTLRYAVQLLTPAFLMARINGRESVSVDDVNEINGLFRDAKTSVRFKLKSLFNIYHSHGILDLSSLCSTMSCTAIYTAI